jgi:hypothetical protein
MRSEDPSWTQEGRGRLHGRSGSRYALARSNLVGVQVAGEPVQDRLESHQPVCG